MEFHPLNEHSLFTIHAGLRNGTLEEWKRDSDGRMWYRPTEIAASLADEHFDATTLAEAYGLIDGQGNGSTIYCSHRQKTILAQLGMIDTEEVESSDEDDEAEIADDEEQEDFID